MGKEIEDVLKYTQEPPDRGVIRRAYKKWRERHGLLDRCDNPACQFHGGALVWNGKPFKAILDHKNGNNSDNNPKNLRYLCPNCDAQLDTRGGANKGRIEKSEGGFAIKSKDGKRNYVIPVEAGKLEISGHAPGVTITPIPKKPTGS